jgi:pteridine reductase
MSTSTDTHKFALVTGGSRRIGKAIALHLARLGYDVGVHFWTSADDAIRTKAEIESLGRKCYLYKADLSNPVEIENMFKEVTFSIPAIDVLVNSAAIMPKSDLLKISPQDWDRIIDINLRAPWLVSMRAGTIMKTGGAILNISDAGAEMHWTGYGAYGISKCGLNELTRLLAKQLAPAVRVNAIAPGLLLRAEEMAEDDWNLLASRVPMQSAGDMNSLMATIDLLISNGYITGEIITLNGGASLG